MSEHEDTVRAEIEALQRQLAEIAARLGDLQRAAGASAAADAGAVPAAAAADRASEVAAPVTAAEPPAAAPGAAPDELAEETVLVIAAAVAAYFGERVRVRQIRLISSPAWAQQGRVSIQASHRLER